MKSEIGQRSEKAVSKANKSRPNNLGSIRAHPTGHTHTSHVRGDLYGRFGCCILSDTSGREPELPALIPAAVLLVVLYLFHSLTVQVTPNDIVIAFGPGLIQKSFMIGEIERASAVRTRWYHGWGIKKIWGGWLFNVSGFDAVQIELRNGKLYQIGTDEPQRLREAILEAMEESRSFRR